MGPSSRTIVKVGLDALVVAAAVSLAYVSRFERFPAGAYGQQLLFMLPALAVIRLMCNRAFGVYRQSWRLFGLPEALLFATSAGVVTLGLVVSRLAMPWVAPGAYTVPFGVIALEGLFSLTGSVGVRVAARVLDEHTRRERRRLEAGEVRRAILVGAGRVGRMAARELRQRPDTGYEVVGFLDDDPNRHGQVIEGVKVLGTTQAAGELADAAAAEVFILTMPSATRAQVRAVVERCRVAGLPVRTVPGYHDLLGGKVSVAKIRPLRIEDLLGRDVVDFDEQSRSKVQSAFSGKRILVTGAGGSIGSELCRQLSELNPATLILFENNENNLFDIDNEIRDALGARAVACLADVREADDVERVFAEHKPEVVFHAAAYKHVPMMERHPEAAIDNNVRGTKTVVEAAHRHDVERFLFVSTDKAVNPGNVMGASKRVAEMIVQAQAAASKTKFCCTRFGNVLGSRGSVLHTFQRQIEGGGPVTVTHAEVTRFFMTIPEAVRLLIQSAAVGEGGEVFLLDMGEPVKIVDLATQMIRLAGFNLEDVPLQIVGLRPGEKLHEELLRDDEGAEPSGVEGVFLAKLAPVEQGAMATWVDRLRAAAEANDAATIRRLLAVSTGYRAGSDALGPSKGKDAEVIAIG